MLTLLLLVLTLAAIAGTAAAAVTRPVEPLSPEQALPVGLLGLSWRRLGERQTAGGPRMLWLAEGDAGQYSRLYNADRENMRAVGFGWGGVFRGDVSSPVCWERLPAPSDAAYAEAVSRAVAAAVAEEERRAATEAERERKFTEAKEAIWLLEGEARLADLQALRDRLKALPWAWTRKQRDLATEVFAEAERPSGWAAKQARKLVETVDAMLARVTARAQTERVERFFVIAADPVVQMDAHLATKILSDRDADYASIDNAEGWSKAHCHMGHVLSEMPGLGQTETAHALRVVYPHRRQLPADLRRRLFREA